MWDLSYLNFTSSYLVKWGTAPEEEDEVLLSPEATYAPPGLDLSCPVALTVAHCADLSGPADATWAVRLRRRTPENKWEEVMSMDKESTSCYGLLEASRRGPRPQQPAGLQPEGVLRGRGGGGEED
ncbi:unnamed protein product [Arctogadus glacialis]